MKKNNLLFTGRIKTQERQGMHVIVCTFWYHLQGQNKSIAIHDGRDSVDVSAVLLPVLPLDVTFLSIYVDSRTICIYIFTKRWLYLQGLHVGRNYMQRGQGMADLTALNLALFIHPFRFQIKYKNISYIYTRHHATQLSIIKPSKSSMLR